MQPNCNLKIYNRPSIENNGAGERICPRIYEDLSVENDVDYMFDFPISLDNVPNQHTSYVSNDAISIEKLKGKLSTNSDVQVSKTEKGIELLRHVRSGYNESDYEFYLRSRYYFLSCDNDDYHVDDYGLSIVNNESLAKNLPLTKIYSKPQNEVRYNGIDCENEKITYSTNENDDQTISESDKNDCKVSPDNNIDNNAKLNLEDNNHPKDIINVTYSSNMVDVNKTQTSNMGIMDSVTRFIPNSNGDCEALDDKIETTSYEKLGEFEKEKIILQLPNNGADDMRMNMVETIDVIIPLGSLVRSSSKCLTSVMQALYSCKKVRTHIVDYHKSDMIVASSSSVESNQDLIFVNDFCRLFSDMMDRKNRIVSKVYDQFSENLTVRQCYESILGMIDQVTKTEILVRTGSTNDAEKEFFEYQSRHNGFIFDLFFGQIISRRWCTNCSLIQEEKFDIIRSIQLERGLGEGFIDIQLCIDDYFADEDQSNQGCQPMNCCGNGRLMSRKTMSHAPEYILFTIVINDRLDRMHAVNYNPSYDGYLVPDINGCVLYSIQAIISNINGLYCAQCLYDQWYFITDFEKPSISRTVRHIYANVEGLLMKRADSLA